MHRRTLLKFAAGGVLAQATFPLAAQRSGAPLRIVIGFAAGGSTDALARQVAAALSAALGRPVLVENKTGASGRLAVQEVMSAAADGSTLLLAPHGAMTLFPHIYRSLPYEPATDFSPITRVTTSDYVLSVATDSPARDVASFKEWASTRKGGLTYGSPGAGTVLHFLGMQIGRGIDAPMTHVAYRGAAPAMIDLMGGTIDATVTPIGDALALHNAGRIRIVASTGDAPSPLVQGVPTMRQGGVDVDVTAWTALYGPAGVPAATVDRLHGELRNILQSSAMREQLAAIAFAAAPTTPAELAALQDDESAMWAAVVKESGFTPED